MDKPEGNGAKFLAVWSVDVREMVRESENERQSDRMMAVFGTTFQKINQKLSDLCQLLLKLTDHSSTSHNMVVFWSVCEISTGSLSRVTVLNWYVSEIYSWRQIDSMFFSVLSIEMDGTRNCIVVFSITIILLTASAPFVKHHNWDWYRNHFSTEDNWFCVL